MLACVESQDGFHSLWIFWWVGGFGWFSCIYTVYTQINIYTKIPVFLLFSVSGVFVTVRQHLQRARYWWRSCCFPGISELKSETRNFNWFCLHPKQVGEIHGVSDVCFPCCPWYVCLITLIWMLQHPPQGEPSQNNHGWSAYAPLPRTTL